MSCGRRWDRRHRVGECVVIGRSVGDAVGEGGRFFGGDGDGLRMICGVGGSVGEFVGFCWRVCDGLRDGVRRRVVNGTGIGSATF